MSTVTELALFKQCINNPKHLTFIDDLSLDKISNPSDFLTLSAHDIQKKKALRLFHMVWSGTTKYIRQICV